MSATTVLFDLDGTLLPMDQELFMKAYFGGLSKRLAPYGYEPKSLIDAIWTGTRAMVKNDGKENNETVFWKAFADIFGERVYGDLSKFEDYYVHDFDGVAKSCGFAPEAREIVDHLKVRGMRVVLATNPLFPSIATEKRIAWAGLDPKDFEFFTTYENSCHCKPNLDYYRDILRTIGVSAEECLMVGNDVDEDMVAQELGMKVFLLTDCLINKSGTDVNRYPHGGFSELKNYLESLS